MNCREATELLERMIFEEVPTDADLKQHIASCPSCGQVYRDVMKARKVITVVQRSVPKLEDPDEVTDNIMFAIQQEPDETALFPLYFQRMVAAASIALFLLFAYEQYGVVLKVSRLESKLAETTLKSHKSDPRRRASTFDINRAGLSVFEIQRLIARENRKYIQSLSSFGKK